MHAVGNDECCGRHCQLGAYMALNSWEGLTKHFVGMPHECELGVLRYWRTDQKNKFVGAPHEVDCMA